MSESRVWTIYRCPATGRTGTVDSSRTCDCPAPFEVIEVVPKDTLASAIVAGVEVAGKVRDANQSERRRLEAENARLRQAISNAIYRLDAIPISPRLIIAREALTTALEGGE